MDWLKEFYKKIRDLKYFVCVCIALVSQDLVLLRFKLTYQISRENTKCNFRQDFTTRQLQVHIFTTSNSFV